MKRSKKLLSLLLVLAVLIAATAAVSLYTQEQEVQEDTSTVVFTLDKDTVTKIGWDYSEEISFTAGEDGWVYEDDPAFPVEESYLDAMLESLAEVKASRNLGTTDDLDQYGLEVPVCVVTVTTDETHTLSIGHETAVGGERYFSNGDGNVYLVDSGLLESFSYGLYDILKTETVPKVESLSGMLVETEESSYRLVYEEASGKAYSDEYVWFLGDKALDTELTQSLISMVTDLNLAQCVDYNAQDLAQYGLDDPSVKATVYDGGKKAFTVEVGSEKDDQCYVRLAGSNMVYQVDSQLCNTLMYSTYADLRPDEVIKLDWDTVDSVTVTLDGQDYTLILQTQEVTDEEGSTTQQTQWTLDGEETEFGSTLESLTDMDSSGYASGLQPEGTPWITFSIHRDQQDYSLVTLAFYPYNSTDCIVMLNEEATVTVDREDAQDLLEAVRDLLPE